MDFIKYTPNNVIFPPDIVRPYVDKLISVAKLRPSHPKYHYSRDDEIPIIYDIFRTPDDSRIVALLFDWNVLHSSLPKGNFKPNPDMEFYHKGELIRPSSFLRKKDQSMYRKETGMIYLEQMRKLFIFSEFTLPENLRNTPEIEIDILFKKGLVRKKVFLKKSPFANLPQKSMALSSMQKGNQLQWIEDWMTYYCLEHKVGYIVLYDNGSETYPEIEKHLSGMSLPLTCVLIRWNYPFVHFRTQVATLNHCMRFLGNRARYYLNFDIDEYLVNRSNLTLERYLDTHKKKRTFYFSFPERAVPRYSEKPVSDKKVRVTDFQFVRTQTISEITQTKTINIQGTPVCATLHNTFSHKISLLFPMVLLEQSVRRWIRPPDIPDRLSRSKFGLAGRFIGKLKGLTASVWLRLRARAVFYSFTHNCFKVPNNELYFNHYKGTNTGWKGTHKKYDAPPPGAVRDQFMIDKFRHLGLSKKNKETASK